MYIYMNMNMNMYKVCKVYADELDRCKQYNNFILVMETALFLMAIDRGCYNPATDERSMSEMKTFRLVAF
jgi:hypothetical protein